MQHYLVVFDRSGADEVRLRKFETSAEALLARLEAEQVHRDNPEIEIVVLSAESRESLRLTHARYFDSLADLARRGARTLGRQRDHALGVA